MNGSSKIDTTESLDSDDPSIMSKENETKVRKSTNFISSSSLYYVEEYINNTHSLFHSIFF